MRILAFSAWDGDLRSLNRNLAQYGSLEIEEYDLLLDPQRDDYSPEARRACRQRASKLLRWVKRKQQEGHEVALV